jgi:hypothetical protein
MAFTYSKLADITVVVSGAASIDFTNIPQNYTDLILKFSLRDNFASVSVNCGIKVNGSASNLAGRVIFGTGSTANSTTVTDSIAYTVGTSGTASTFSSSEVYIPNYTSGINKSMSAESVAESNATTVYMQMVAELWSNVTTVSQLTLYPINASLFTQYSTATLYGVKAEV